MTQTRKVKRSDSTTAVNRALSRSSNGIRITNGQRSTILSKSAGGKAKTGGSRKK